jgi:hypothetical protein
LKWFAANKLAVNAAKSQFVLFGTQHPNIVSIQVGGKRVSRSNQVVYLGLRIDCKLTWCAHINYIISRIKQFRYMVTRLRCAFDPTLRAYLAKVFILPIIDLYSVIYASSTASCLRRLDVVYNDLMRTITGVHRSDRINIDRLYQMSSLEPLCERRDRLLLSFMLKLSNRDVHSMLQAQCVPFSKTHDTRSRNQYVVPRYSTNFGFNRILVRGLRLLNRTSSAAE